MVSRQISAVRCVLLVAIGWMAPQYLAAERTTIMSGPDRWQAEAPRTQIAPKFQVRKQQDSKDVLVAVGNGSVATCGWWAKDFDVKGGDWYRLEAKYEAADVALPRRSVLVRLTRFDENGEQIQQTEYPSTRVSALPDGASSTETTSSAPGGRTTTARPWGRSFLFRLAHRESTRISGARAHGDRLGTTDTNPTHTPIRSAYQPEAQARAHFP